MKKPIILFLLVLAAITGQAQTGTWSGNLVVQGLKLPLVFHIEADSSSLDSPSQGVRGVPVKVARPTQDSIVISIASINAEYKGVNKADSLVEGTFTQHGMSSPLKLTPGEKKAKRPQTPKAPFPYATEEVSFTNGSAILKGTLTLPQGCTQKTPVLIMVTGSGLQNRDEEIFEHKPFAVIADALAREGIATLRYDDRGFGESKGNTITCTTDSLKDDALAGINLLRERFDRVGVIGHSEGGTIALMLAAEGKTDFIVSLAGMVISGKETLVWQNRQEFKRLGFDEAAVNDYCQLFSDAIDARVEGKNVPSVDGHDLPDVMKQNYQQAVMQMMYPYLRAFCTLDMRKLLDKITCPVLALNGTKDTQVEYEANLGALRQGLPKAQTVVMEGLNHMFQHCTTGAGEEYNEIEETFAPEALQKIISWIKQI